VRCDTDRSTLNYLRGKEDEKEEEEEEEEEKKGAIW
jgi:hypothetical protein